MLLSRVSHRSDYTKNEKKKKKRDHEKKILKKKMRKKKKERPGQYSRFCNELKSFENLISRVRGPEGRRKGKKKRKGTSEDLQGNLTPKLSKPVT